MSRISSSGIKNTEYEQQRTANRRVNDQTLEEHSVSNRSQVNEERCNCNNPDIEPRYDSEELRDAARKLGPFIRLIEDTNNPYARIIAREVCKTFYQLFHPNDHPIDVIRSVNWNAKSQRTDQLWAEFWLYVEGSQVKDWEPLCVPSESGDLNYNGLQPISLMDVFNADENCVQKDSILQLQMQYPKYNNARSSNICQNVEQNCPSNYDENMCEHQYAGSDSLVYTNNFNSISRRPISPVLKYFNNQSMYANELDRKWICDQITDSKYQREKVAETASNQCYICEDNIGKNKTTHFNLELMTKRHSAGYDTQNCDSITTSNAVSNQTADPYEYYRITGNTPSPQQAQSYIFRPISNPPSPIYPEEPLDNAIVSDEECTNQDSVNGAELPNENEIAYNASLVANAFTSLSIAAQDLRKKKDAFKILTQNYLSLISSQDNNDSKSSVNGSNAQKALDTITSNQPKAVRTFIDHELNANAFKDRDFVRLLPFFESIHNKLEYIAKEQKDYGINMLDDIMSTLYHIYYDLGDPRLKSDILAEHVKLITRNTWELYFYDETNRMPDIPELPIYTQSPQRLSTIPEILVSPSSSQNIPSRSYQPPPCNPSTSHDSSAIPYHQQPLCNQSTAQNSSAIPFKLPQCNPSTSQGSSAIPFKLPQCNPSTSQGSSSIPFKLPQCNPSTSQGSSAAPYQQPSSYPSISQNMAQQSNPNTSLRPPELRLPNPRPPILKQSKQRCPQAKLSTNVNRKIQAPIKRREADVPEPITNVPEPQTNKCKFLRRSRPSGAPKGWAPTVKPVERPDNFQEFRAKPLPKFVRQRLCSRNEER